MNDATRQILNVLFALTLFPAGSLPFWSGIGKPVAEISRQSGFAPETPAGWAFAIWSAIFTLTLIYAVWQALPANAANPLYRHIGWATAISSLLNTVWMLLAQTIGNGWWLVVIIFGIWLAAMSALVGATALRTQHTAFDRYIVMPMTGLLAGWLSAAVWLNLSSWLKIALPDILSLGRTTIALVVLSAAAITWLTTLRQTRGNVWYAAAAAWALVGVIAANLTAAEGAIAVAASAAVVGILVLATTALSQRAPAQMEAAL